jgi:hypothetical protein
MREQNRKVIIERVRLIRQDVALAIVRITDLKEAWQADRPIHDRIR